MNNFYIVFGYGHYHEIGDKFFNRDCIAKIEATCKTDATLKAKGLFGEGFYSVDDEEPEMKFYKRGFIEV